MAELEECREIIANDCTCGSSNIMSHYDGDKKIYYVFCHECKLSTTGNFLLRSAVQAWNELVTR